MKKTILYCTLLTTVALCSCNKDEGFGDWASPQGYEEDPIAITLNATPAGTIDLSNATTSTVKVFSTDAAPTGFSKTSNTVKVVNECGSKILDATLDGEVDVQKLTTAIKTLCGWEENQSIPTVVTTSITKSDHNGFTVASDTITTDYKMPAHTEAAPTKVYMIGDLQEWTPTCTTAPFTQSASDPNEFTISVDVTGMEGDKWFAFTDNVTVASGDWSKVYGNWIGDGGVIGSKGFMDRRCNLGGDNSWKVTLDGTQKTLKVTLNFKSGSYLIEAE